MPKAFRQVGSKVTLAANLTKGEVPEMRVKVWKLAGLARNEVELDKDVMKFSGGRAKFTWETKKALEANELAGHFHFEIRHDEESRGEADVVVYHPTIEVKVVDLRGRAIKGVEVKLSVEVDHDFAAAEIAYADDGEDGDHEDEKVWRKVTDSGGKVTFKKLPLGRVTVEFPRPYMMADDDDDGWVVQEKYTATGPTRKARLEKVPVVHYVWAGNPSTDEYRANAMDTPRAMAALRVAAYYWRQPVEGAFGGDTPIVFPQNLEEKVIEAPFDLLKNDRGSVDGVFMGRQGLLTSILDTLKQYRCLSAVKDLLSLLILYKHGGYYFDTTTALVAEDLATIPPQLVAHDEFRIARTKTGGLFYFDPDDRSLAGTLCANTNPGWRNRQGVVHTHGCDVWAMYAPPGHKAIRTMIDSYIERAQALGLDQHNREIPITETQFDVLVNFNPNWAQLRTIHQILTEDWEGTENDEAAPKKWRNHVIGQLIICAVQEGIYTYFKKKKKWKAFDPDEHPSYMWATSEPTQEQTDEHHIQGLLADLGLGKQHAGSWRVQGANA